MVTHSPEVWARCRERHHLPVSYVYILKDKSGHPVYVGMGRGPRFHNSTLNTRATGGGEIVVSGLTRAQALEVEARLIRIMGRKGIDPLGILLNRQLAR